MNRGKIAISICLTVILFVISITYGVKRHCGGVYIVDGCSWDFNPLLWPTIYIIKGAFSLEAGGGMPAPLGAVLPKIAVLINLIYLLLMSTGIVFIAGTFFLRIRSESAKK